jgi:hypothetical protein
MAALDDLCAEMNSKLELNHRGDPHLSEPVTVSSHLRRGNPPVYYNNEKPHAWYRDRWIAFDSATKKYRVYSAS